MLQQLDLDMFGLADVFTSGGGAGGGWMYVVWKRG